MEDPDCCERCGESYDDQSYWPVCGDCYWALLGLEDGEDAYISLESLGLTMEEEE